MSNTSIMMQLIFLLFLLCATAPQIRVASADSAAAAGSAASADGSKKTSDQSLMDLEYSRVYPRRTEEEAAVLEWGNSAIISALDASVAHFGPQTSQAALLEVEAMPILASPINGVFEKPKKKKKTEKNEASENIEGEEEATIKEEEEEEEVAIKPTIKPLDNAEEVHGNMVVMTNMGHELTGVEMAKIAQESGAAALLVVNVDEERPEDIFRLQADEGADEIQIPVVMISLNSANVLTTATVTPEMKRRDIVNNGMPDRVRLYAGGDRPFFEDVEAVDPTVYLIHNLLTAQECDSLIQQASTRVTPITKSDPLQLTHDPEKYAGVERVMLWQGLLYSPSRKQIEERIEQVTGFPSSHFSDFVVDRLERGSHWKPRYDVFGSGTSPTSVPMASITIFLTGEHPEGGAEIVYPSTLSEEPLQIRPRKGLAVVHHNTDENNQFDMNSIHAILPARGTTYIARKYIYGTPISNARRVALPVYSFPFGGKLPTALVTLHDVLVETFGEEQGGFFFEKLCVFIPCFIALLIVQALVGFIRRKLSEESAPAATTTTISSSKASSQKPAATSTKKKGKKE